MGELLENFLTRIGSVSVLAIIFLCLNFINEGTSTTVVTSPTPSRTEKTPMVHAENPPADTSPTLPPQQEQSSQKVTPIKNVSNEPKKDSSQTETITIAQKKPTYPFPPLAFDSINVTTRSALVNILCTPHGGTFRPISGSGVLIDPRGVILTNAHVAQYVLLANSGKFDLSCVIRGGSPASPLWNAEVLFMPSVWVTEHAKDVNADKPRSTGEHDYALLKVTTSVNGTDISSPLPFIPIETREEIEFPADPVLVAGYPAEFVGGLAATANLYAVSSVTTIKTLLTFETGSVDLFSVGGVIEAQGGSSGGAVVNQWNYLVGIITTTSEGATTGERELHIITLDYINRDMSLQAGMSIGETLSGDVWQRLQQFGKNEAPGLTEKFLKQISPRQ